MVILTYILRSGDIAIFVVGHDEIIVVEILKLAKIGYVTFTIIL